MTDEHDPLNPKWTHAEIEILKARGAKPMEFNKIPPPSAAVVQSVIDALSKRTNEAGMLPISILDRIAGDCLEITTEHIDGNTLVQKICIKEA